MTGGTAGRRTLVIGHRGASGYRPEHSRGAYELAFALGADAVEPDIVASRDGVLVIRHENEISGTTDVAAHPEFVGRRTTKEVDGVVQTGWFTEDFTWAELATLRTRERLGQLRPASAAYDGAEPILRLQDLLQLIDDSDTPSMPLLVAEVKHASYFASLGLPLDALFTDTLAAAAWDRRPQQLIIESFERGVLSEIRARSVAGQYVYLMEASGVAVDEQRSAHPRSYAEQLTASGLAELAAPSPDRVDGISLDQAVLASSPGLVAAAKSAGLAVYTWTLRPENLFLASDFRVGDDPAAFGNFADAWRRLLALGLDGVFADHPDLAVAVRDGGHA